MISNNKKTDSIKLRYKNMKFIVHVLYKSSIALALLLFVISLLSGLTMAVELWAITGFINEVTQFDQWSLSYLNLLRHFSPFISLFIVALLINNIVSSSQPYLAEKLNEKVSVYLNNQLFDKSMKLKLEVLENADYYNRLENSVSVVQRQLVYNLEYLGQFIGMSFQLLVIIFAMSQVGLIYGILLILCCIPLFYVQIKSNKEFIEVNYGQSKSRRRQGYWNHVATSREMAAELRLLQLGGYIIHRWKEETKDLIDELLQARTKMAVQDFKGGIFYLTLLFIMMGITVYTGVQGDISIGSVVATLYLLDRLEGVVNVSSSLMSELGQFYFRFQAIPKFLELDEEEISTGLSAPLVLKKGIQFDHVSFKYPGQTDYALRDVSFFLKPGERIAIVGENGAGKSTLCLLILGLYRPTEGKIIIDDLNLNELDPKTWRQKAAAVFQNFEKYQLTVNENIAFGQIDQIHDEEKIEAAAMKSGIDVEINKLPHKYNTLLGKQYQDSQDLSGGQWQKIAISRAYFREAELLILDEPVSALDAQAEYDVYKQFSDISVGKIVLIVSHRLGSARLANRILFLKDGQLIETGSHEELIIRGGEYATLFQMQSKWYMEEEAMG